MEGILESSQVITEHERQLDESRFKEVLKQIMPIHFIFQEIHIIVLLIKQYIINIYIYSQLHQNFDLI